MNQVFSRVRMLVGSAAVAAAALAGGCTQMLGFGGSSGSLVSESLETGATYRPTFETVVYRFTDGDEADVLLTDIPVNRLADPADTLADVSGNLVHIRMFFRPEAGATPVDTTACNSTVRHAVLSSGAVGIYAGAGFMTPWRTPGGERFGATVHSVSMRAIRRTADFADRLGPGRITGSFNAALDERAANALLDRLTRLDTGLERPAKRQLLQRTETEPGTKPAER